MVSTSIEYQLKIPATNNAKIYPYLTIRKALDEGVENLYGENKAQYIRLVRLRKQIEVGHLQYVDYAVPCFELAKNLGEDPNKVAAQLKMYLKTSLQSGVRFDHIAGYLNIQLTDETLRQSCKASLKLIQEGFSEGANIAATRESINIIIYQSSKKQSEKDAALLHHCIQTIDWVASAGHVDTIVCGMNYLLDNNLQGADFHSFIDHLSHKISKDTGNLITDSITHAAYLAIGDHTFGLRTSKGVILSLAHFIYQFNTLLMNNGDEEPMFSLVLAPQEEHDSIRALASALSWDLSRIILYDPQVSQADITEISNQFNTPQNMATKISEVLSNIENDTLVQEKRKEILLLIDYPLEVITRLAECNIPLIFDLTNQAALSLQMIQE